MVFIYLNKVTVLTEQVEAQGERIRELDSTLEDRKEQLDGTEEMLQQVCNRNFKI